jgi:CubicO group peptidase (beta-lactamase class C family)
LEPTGVLPSVTELAEELDDLAEREQRDQRLPALTAAAVRDGEIVWERAIGAADVESGSAAQPDTQFRIASITKTFTAAAAMQLRERGRLGLDAPLDHYVEGAAHSPTLRQLLSHTSGLQRETQDFPWVTKRFAPTEELLETLGEAECVLPPGSRYHYSNLGFTLLGIAIERVTGRPYVEYVEEQLLRPLRLEHTSFEPLPDAATGYLVDAGSGELWREQAFVRTGARLAGGGLWSTVGDLCRWAAFLADPDERVLARASVEEMRTVHTLSDHVRWSEAYGLGLRLTRDRGRILVGHGGSLPGFIANVAFSPEDRIGAAALTNSGTALLNAFVSNVVDKAIEHLPPPEARRPVEEPPPEDVAPLLGTWFMRGIRLEFAWLNGALEARSARDADWQPPNVFAPEAPGCWRSVSGADRGELLYVDGDRLVLSGYVLTRDPTPWA